MITPDRDDLVRDHALADQVRDRGLAAARRAEEDVGSGSVGGGGGMEEKAALPEEAPGVDGGEERLERRRVEGLLDPPAPRPLVERPVEARPLDRKDAPGSSEAGEGTRPASRHFLRGRRRHFDADQKLRRSVRSELRVAGGEKIPEGLVRALDPAGDAGDVKGT